MSARRQEGFTLVELLIAMVLLVGLTLAILATLEGFTRAQGRASSATRAQAAVRDSTDRLARDLRNGAGGGGSGAVVASAAAGDLVLATPATQTSAAGRIRYCVGASSGVAGGKSLWRQLRVTSPVTAAVGVACPDSSWGTAEEMLRGLVPPAGASAVAPFAYDATTPADVSRIWVTLAVQPDVPGTVAVPLSTGIALRNQNRAPVASFTATPTSQNRALLDGSNSADPDDQTLTYQWTDGAVQIGTTAVLNYQAPTAGTHAISLTVRDPGGADDTVTQQVVLQ